MSDTIRCPGCQAQLVLPESSRGLPVQCPRCRQTFDVQAKPVVKPAPAKRSPPRYQADDAIDPLKLQAVPMTPRPGHLRGGAAGVFAIVCLGFHLFACVLGTYVHLDRGLQINNALARPHNFVPFNGNFQAEQDWHDFTVSVHTFHQLTALASAILSLVWLYQASSNLRPLGSVGMKNTPGWAVVAFFLPIWNLFLPITVMQELWRASHPRGSPDGLAWMDIPGNRLVPLWWCTFLASAIGVSFGGHDLFIGINETERNLAFLAAFADLLRIASGGTMIYLIYDIMMRQRERFENLGKG